MSTIVIEDLNDQEAQDIINEQLETLTRQLAEKIARDIDPTDPTLADRIEDELNSNPDYLDALKKKIIEGSETGIEDPANFGDLAEEILKSIQSATGSIVPEVVKVFIDKFNKNLSDVT